nr:modular serine protease-like [Onthophagus taurus]
MAVINRLNVPLTGEESTVFRKGFMLLAEAAIRRIHAVKAEEFQQAARLLKSAKPPKSNLTIYERIMDGKEYDNKMTSRHLQKFQQYSSEVCLDLSTIHGLKIKSSFCNDGRQIFYDKLCDGLVDCIDGSDETAEKCSKIQCPYYSFQCTYGPCINRNKICDGVKDCADNSDENGEFCVATSSCGPMKFRCSSNECIDVFLICDGRKDCKDGSDEIEETCRTTYCPSSFFKCKYGACVAKTADCNGVEECADGSDEIKCSKD